MRERKKEIRKAYNIVVWLKIKRLALEALWVEAIVVDESTIGWEVSNTEEWEI